MESKQITLSEALPEGHLACFTVDIVARLDLSEYYCLSDNLLDSK
jgi:hypothetical protein